MSGMVIQKKGQQTNPFALLFPCCANIILVFGLENQAVVLLVRMQNLGGLSEF
jgi:hypothetical protein